MDRRNPYLLAVLVSLVLVTLSFRCIEGPRVTGTQDDTSGTTVTIDENSFDSLVNESDCAVVEFYSPPCMACQAMKPVYDSIGMLFGDSLLVGRVDVDENMALSDSISVEVVPSFAFFSNGEFVTLRTVEEGDGAFDTLVELIGLLLDGSLEPDSTTGGGTGGTIPEGYITLDTLSFDTTVLREGRVAMVFFLYAGGAPCIYMDSIVQTMVPQFTGRAIIAKVHAWEQYPLSSRYGISSVPHFLFFKDGVEIIEERRLGTYSAETLTAVIERLLVESDTE